MDLRTDETVLAPYDIVEMNGEDVAFVGISTPETYTKSTPTYFQDERMVILSTVFQKIHFMTRYRMQLITPGQKAPTV